jgi:hypothetical protein
MKRLFLIISLVILLTTGCTFPAASAMQNAGEANHPSPTKLISSPTGTSTPLAPSPSPTSPPPSETPLPDALTEPATQEAQAALPSATPVPTLDPDDWQEWPVIPTPSEKVGEIFQRGVELGNNPRAFSKIGDCGSTPAWFLGDFDRGPKFYRLGEYDELQGVIAEFQGSYGRTSLAAKAGFNASSVFAAMWSDRSQCEPNEAPIACEIRIHKPSFALVMLGSNDVYHLDTFEGQMRRMIEFLAENGVVPILSTKADNLEGDGSINATLARLANEYGVPIINYWAAVQPLPSHGLQEDSVHITWSRNFFDDVTAMKSGWAVRNLTSLQALDAVWRAASQNQNARP